MTTNLELGGSGLESELPAFIRHMTQTDPAMAALLESLLPTLTNVSTEDERRAARASFNSKAKATLLASLTDSEEGDA